jgi:hypothetical protein
MCVRAPEETDVVEMTDVDVEAMRDAFVKVSNRLVRRALGGQSL